MSFSGDRAPGRQPNCVGGESRYQKLGNGGSTEGSQPESTPGRRCRFARTRRAWESASRVTPVRQWLGGCLPAPIRGDSGRDLPGFDRWKPAIDPCFRRFGGVTWADRQPSFGSRPWREALGLRRSAQRRGSGGRRGRGGREFQPQRGREVGEDRV